MQAGWLSAARGSAPQPAKGGLSDADVRSRRRLFAEIIAPCDNLAIGELEYAHHADRRDRRSFNRQKPVYPLGKNTIAVSNDAQHVHIEGGNPCRFFRTRKECECLVTPVVFEWPTFSQTVLGVK